MSSGIAIVYIDDSSNRTLVGINDFDRANDGILIPPRVADATARNALTPTINEIVYQLDTDTIWRWDGATWQPLMASVVPGSIDHNALANLTVGNPHTQYQLLSQKGVANGYASLDANSFVLEAITRLRETGGPTTLVVGAISDTQYLVRSGGSIVGIVPPFAQPGGAPVNVNRSAAAAGASALYAREDHKHDIDTAAAVTIGTANSEGVASSLARSDHGHNHGAQTDPTHHAVAVAGVSNGFISAADQQKLDDLGVLGSEYHRAQDLGIDTNSTTTFDQKVTLGPIALDGGDYKIEWGYGWNHNSQANDFEGRLLQNAVQLGELHKQEPKDSAGGDPTGTTQRYYLQRKRFETLAAGNYTWVIEYRTDTGGSASSIWEATIEVTRVP